MQSSLPSRRRAGRFLLVFYAATVVLYLAFYTVVGLFGVSLNVVASVFWPAFIHASPVHGAVMVLGLALSIAEPRVTEVLH